MAGQCSGAPASVLASPGARQASPLHLPHATTRTRRSHGAFPLGGIVASVYSSRRECDGRVTLAVGRDTMRLDVSMSAAQARAMASVLLSAATAADAAVGCLAAPVGPAMKVNLAGGAR